MPRLASPLTTHPAPRPAAAAATGSSRPRAWHQTFFLLAAAHRCPRTSVGQSPPPRPSCNGPPPHPGRHRHSFRASLRGLLAPRPSTRRRRPGYTSPSSGPWRQTRRRDSYPPVSICPVRKFFQKIIPDKFGNIPTNPRVMGPRAARISNGFWVEGLAGAGRLTEYPPGSVTCLLRRDRASTQGLVQDWGRCRWRCPQRASSARRRTTAPRTISTRLQLPVSALFARVPIRTIWKN